MFNLNHDKFTHGDEFRAHQIVIQLLHRGHSSVATYQNAVPSVMSGASGTHEFSCIEKYIRPLMRSGFRTENDDAAQVSSPNKSFIVTQDMIVEGIHFLRSSNPILLAQKALRVNLSDIAAMGARPHAYLLGLSLPQGITEEWWKQFSEGLKEDNETYAIDLIGGDTTSNGTGAITISVTAMGIPDTCSMTRSKAQIGDLLYVSGNIGDSTLGLMAYQGLIAGECGYLKRRYDLPEPRVSLGRKICGIASACIDISDGLIQDIEHICQLSNVGAILEMNKVPVSNEARHVLQHNPKLAERILSGGDDYELAFTAAVENREKIMLIAADINVKITEIGIVTEQPGVRVYDNYGNITRFTDRGYQHRF